MPKPITKPALAIIVPTYNEERHLYNVIQGIISVCAPHHPLYVVIVDDASVDGTPAIGRRLQVEHPGVVTVVTHSTNQGKGAACATGLLHVPENTHIIAILDADGEYDPADILPMAALIASNQADAVFGSRKVGGRPRRAHYFWHTLANTWLTLLSNLLTNLNLTDMACCTKVFSRHVAERLTLRERGFAIDAEIIAKTAKMRIDEQKVRIYETGVAYHGRGYADGKKIGAMDAVRILWAILKYALR